MSSINKKEYLRVEPIIECNNPDKNLNFDDNHILMKPKIPIKLKIVEKGNSIKPKMPIKLKIREEWRSIKHKIPIKLKIAEEWRPIIGYERSYKVSNFGNIISLFSNKIMKKTKNINGYESVCL